MTNENGAHIQEIETKSVIDRPDAPSARSPVPSYEPMAQVLMLVGQMSEDIIPWGTNVKARDKMLRQYAVAENIFACALGIICSRNAGFSWKISGPPRTTGILQEVFDLANMGLGWQDLIVKTSVDLYTQDNGAFWEIVRRDNSNPSSPVIGINHLDSAQCWHTGAPSAPVIYIDINGKAHLLRSWQVIEFAEMPMPVERLYGQQLCALSRVFRSMHKQRNIAIYDDEKTGGRFTRRLTLVKGLTTQQIQDGIAQAESSADNAGLTRFMRPVYMGTIDPTADVGHDDIDLVGMPEGYKAEEDFKLYINLISMAFESDYQEFAPLPGGGLGTGNQSEILHLKNRGKGPGYFMKMITQAVNKRILPANVQFFFDEQDLEAEKNDAEVRAIRAQTRKTRIESGEIDPYVARQIANDDGDLHYEYLTYLGETDLRPDMNLADEAKPDVLNRTIKPENVRRADADRIAARQPNPTASRPNQPQQE